MLSLLSHSGLRRSGRSKSDTQRAFTLVELVLVIAFSLILMVGLIGLVNMSMNMFNSSRNLQAITDTGRMVLSAVSRQLQGALMLAPGSPDCTHTKITFWSDVTGEFPDAEAREELSAGIYHYTQAPRVAFYKPGNEDTVVQDMTKPGSGQPTVGSRIGSYVEELNFYYYPWSSVPDWGDIENDTRQIDLSLPDPQLNKNTGLVAVELVMRKGRVTRTFRQNVAIRCFNTEDIEE